MAGRINNQADKIDGLKKGLEEGPRFPTGVSSFAAGMAVLPREEFAKKFDVGVPLDIPNARNEQVVLLYSGKDSLPTSDAEKTLQATSNSQIPLMDSVDVATENCDMVNLILAQPNDKRQCFAVMGQFRSYHIQKFMRLPEKAGERLDPSAPLRLVNRGAQTSGRLSAKAPTKEETAEYWVSLTKYLQTLDHVLEELKPLAEKVAKENTGKRCRTGTAMMACPTEVGLSHEMAFNFLVIVMVCNLGQSELLLNFVCAAKSRGIDLSAVLVFATDPETKELAEGLGLTAFYDEVVRTKRARIFVDVSLFASFSQH